MEQKRYIKIWHRVLALFLGYLAAGFTYVYLPILFAHPTGALRGITGSPVFSIEMLQAVATIAAIAAWIFIYSACVRSWGKVAE
jgi:hypothetical protein